MRPTNFWKRFRDLIADPIEEIATVQVIYDGWCTAKTLDGGTLRLRCAISGIAVGDKVFTASGEVRARAPNLSAFEIEV